MNPAPAHAILPSHDSLSLDQALQALALAGALALNQPIEHPGRAARLAMRLARAAGASDTACLHARMVAQLRWSGRMATAARAQREVAGDLAALMGLPSQVELALRGSEVAELACYATLAGDLDILVRIHGTEQALAIVRRKAGLRYPPALVELADQQLRAWLDQLEDEAAEPPATAFLPMSVPLTVVADTVELKLPWLAGYAREVARVAAHAAQAMGVPDAQSRSLTRAALLHGLGRAAIANTVWDRPGKLNTADWEAVRRSPYWTARMLARIPGMEADALLASQAYERLDGSGYFRSLRRDALDLPQRLLAASAAFVALRSPRPWRAAHQHGAAVAILDAQASGGRLDRDAVAAVAAVPARLPVSAHALLGARELEVLRRLCRGESIRAMGRALRITPGAVRIHIDSIFAALACQSRPAATLKALGLGLL